MQIRKLLINLHLCTALIAGLFIVVLGVTGSVMAFENDIDELLHQALFKVQSGSSPLPVSAIQKALMLAYPTEKFAYLGLPQTPDAPYVTQTRNMQVFIDGYTGRILGTRSLPTTLSQIHQLHLRLLMGQRGAVLVCAAAIVLVWLVISGIYLWWPLKRVKVKSGASFRRVVFDLHNAIGIYSAVLLFLLALTGVFIYFDHAIAAGLNSITHSTAPRRGLPSVVQSGVQPITPDLAIQIATTALPGAKTVAIALPRNPEDSYSVAMRFSEDRTPGGRSWVDVDQYSGKLLFVENSRTAPLGTKTVIENRAIHTGDIFGYPTKILMSLSSLMGAVQVLTGYCMWWKRLRLTKSHVSRTEFPPAAIVLSVYA